MAVELVDIAGVEGAVENRFCVLSEQRDALELKLKAQVQSLSTFGDENSRLRLQDQEMTALVAELKSQRLKLENKARDQDKLNEKETLVSVTVEDRLLRPEKVESPLGSTLPTKTADLDALVEKLQSKVKELETLQSEAQNHDELLMEVMAQNVGFSERSEAQRDDLRNLAHEKDALLSVLGADQLVHASDLANARSALAVAQEEALRLQAALDISFLSDVGSDCLEWGLRASHLSACGRRIRRHRRMHFIYTIPGNIKHVVGHVGLVLRR
ncbi:hypothetical protein BV25DRAFT_1843003 [Artomyces pyxidatus]|uniref:Uncharacterized protein n=1 Tax=Artomyces pyxidatus TaxID=48021 RepID=A0ACB8SFY5_9AGAM|nr:hypothetical protein BV25DRAFT_1843003 [Artomyces pyxidatus]